MRQWWTTFVAVSICLETISAVKFVAPAAAGPAGNLTSELPPPPFFPTYIPVHSILFAYTILFEVQGGNEYIFSYISHCLVHNFCILISHGMTTTTPIATNGGNSEQRFSTPPCAPFRGPPAKSQGPSRCAFELYETSKYKSIWYSHFGS